MQLERILIVEDNMSDFHRLNSLLDVEVQPLEVTFSSSISQTKQIIRQKSFDLAFIDLGLPDGSGIDLVSALSQLQSPIPCVVISSLSHEELIVKAIEQGAIGYLLKSEEDAEILKQIRNLQKDWAAIDASVARVILRRFKETITKSNVKNISKPDNLLAVHGYPLTQREMELLDLVARGFTNREIGVHMGLTLNSVESYAKEIYRKLAVHSRTEAVYEARAMGLLA